MHKKVNIFDFDGTIAETNLLKSEAFRYCAKDFGQEIADWFVQYHQDNGGITRQVKIKKLCERINRPDLYDYFISRYEQYLSEKWLVCPLLPEFREYISNTDGINLILSGGAKTEIEDYLEFNNLSNFFLEVFGNPIDKVTNLETIREKYLSDQSDVYFFGDSKLDFDLSNKIESKFIFITKVTEWSPEARDLEKMYLVSKDFALFDLDVL